MPYILLGSGLLVLPYLSVLTLEQWKVLQLLPYGLLAVSGLISLFFGRNRQFYLSLLMAISYWAVINALSDVAENYRSQLILVGGVLLPLNVMILGFLRDRGFSLLQSGGVGVMLVAQLAVLVLVAKEGDFGWIANANHFFNSFSWFQTALPDVPLAVVLSLLFSMLLLCLLLIFQRTPFNNALIVVVLALGLSFYHQLRPEAISVLFTIIGLVAILSLLQHSYNMAYRDELTGLLGRRALNERLSRLGGRYCLVMVDVDHFKKFNDTHGHEVGDQVLKMLAGQLAKTAGGARAYRYGGEEFTLVFEGRSALQIEPYLEDLRGRVESYPMRVRSNSRPKNTKQGKKQRHSAAHSGGLKVTISLGAALKSDQCKFYSIHPKQTTNQ